MTPQGRWGQGQNMAGAEVGRRPRAGADPQTVSGGGRAEHPLPPYPDSPAPMPAARGVEVESQAVETRPPPVRPGCARTGGSRTACQAVCSHDPLTLTLGCPVPGGIGEEGLLSSW